VATIFVTFAIRQIMYFSPTLLKEYRSAFVAELMKEKSIIIGSDKFHTIANIQGGDRIFDSLIGMSWNHPQFSLSPARFQ
jgi:hypothetical protein